jgi:RHH-type proline utilization regulon transcriptional repressor/proline dehydrogenase/delta 1-pyrroline-5-carboxylate dehydrogenase
LLGVAGVAVQLARYLQQRAKQLQTPAERRQQAELDRMVQHPRDKATLTQLTDQAFRSESAARAVDQLVHILDVQGVPRFFNPVDRTMLRGFQSFGEYLPGVAVPLVKEKMRRETANVILPAEPEMLSAHLRERSSEGVRMNVNLLGESLLGEHEAQRRLEAYLHALQLPEIECVSVKISTLYSQISTLARNETVRTVSDRLELLYRAALRNQYQRADGTSINKFVYLDMEEYRDMHLTADVFRTTLARPGMETVRAGIALQAYIPDSHRVQTEITQWAIQRVRSGGAPVMIRIVKGANMEMERVEASHRGWPQAPYHRKVETDANYKRMIVYGLKPENCAAVHLGIASHNLFEVAFAMVLSAKVGCIDQVQFEMLEGMANHQRRALHELVDNLLLYAPACRKQDFIHAIGYLVRRMDENTGPDNFLRHAFKIEVDSPDWQRMEQIFLESISLMDRISDQPRRTQNRTYASPQPPPPDHWSSLRNEPDTDFSLAHNSEWAQSIIRTWQPRCQQHATLIALAVGGSDVEGEGAGYSSTDPSRPETIVARYSQASPRQIAMALACAKADRDGWRTLAPQDRYAVLRRVAQRIRQRRGDLIGSAMADGGKTILESDPEVSEAIDFVEFYASTARDIQCEPRLQARPVGTVVVVSPWNFPIAIPCGGIAAALAAGNTVILKPASDTVLPARILCECFWEAGVSRHSLQLIACSGREAGEHLLSSPDVDCTILTGGTHTARQILSARPTLHLLAETGGKNATIVSSLSDRELAIKNVLHSAFSHAGQKCSATSLLLLEEEVYHDEGFHQGLIDAVESLRVGSAWDLRTKMGPLIRPPADPLLRGLKELEPGESWAVMPRDLQENPCLYSPGVKWNVQPGSFTHLTELFGPVLGVLPYRHLNEAIDRVHQTGYGLTSGLESLDDREQRLWTKRMQAGNLYINRPTTGAIVLRQPFGGMGKSAFGPGIKAGGPNYVVPLMHFSKLTDSYAATADARDFRGLSPQLKPLSVFWQQLHSADKPAADVLRKNLQGEGWLQLLRAILDFDQFAAREIRTSHDSLRLVGQDNIRRYLPMSHIRIRLVHSDDWLNIICRAVAVAAVGGRATISRDADFHDEVVDVLEDLTHAWAGDMEFVVESDRELGNAIRHGQVDRVRYASPDHVPPEVRQAADECFVYIADAPVCPWGRVELLWYVREQSVCIDYHRYGNLGFRADEARAPVT